MGRPGLVGDVAMEDRLAVSHVTVGVGRAVAGSRRVGEQKVIAQRISEEGMVDYFRVSSGLIVNTLP